MAGGNPGKYLPEYNKIAYKLALVGFTDEQLASFFEVSVTSIDNWKSSKPEFLGALKKGKDMADANVVASLYKRANGFHKEEKEEIMYKGEKVELVTTKYYPPDVTACIYWLKNRQRDKWGDRKEDLLKDNLVPDIKIIYEPSQKAGE